MTIVSGYADHMAKVNRAAIAADKAARATKPPEMIERVALAIKAEIGKAFDGKPLPGPWSADDWSATGGVLNLEDVARAAIASMREPTEAMTLEGYGHAGGDGYGGACDPRDAWRAMIDEALA